MSFSISNSNINSYGTVLAEVSRDGMKLSQYPEFANNRSIVTAAVRNNFQAMEYASEELKSSEDFARSLIGRVERIGIILPYFSAPVARRIEDEILSSFLDNFSSDNEGKISRLDLRVGR